MGVLNLCGTCRHFQHGTENDDRRTWHMDAFQPKGHAKEHMDWHSMLETSIDILKDVWKYSFSKNEPKGSANISKS
jgi:hypothetical protein